jgi:signal transduction histidine kinase
MREIFKTSLKGKLKLLFGISMIPFVAVAIFSYLQHRELKYRLDHVVREIMPGIASINGLTIALENYRIKQYKFILESDPKKKDSIQREMKEIESNIVRNMTLYSHFTKTPEEETIFSDFTALNTENLEFGKNILLESLVDQNRTMELMTGPSRSLFEKQIRYLGILVQIKQAQAVNSLNDIYSQQLYAVIMLTILPLPVLGIVVLIFWGIARSIMRSITSLQYSMESLATEKKFIPVEVSSSDEIGTLTKSFNEIGTRIKNIMQDLNHLNLTLEAKVAERTHQLEESNKMKDYLFSVIGHDLRSQFSSVYGFSETLINEGDELQPEEKRKYLEIIHNSARNTIRMLDNLLEWARSKSGMITVDKESHDLKMIIGEALEAEAMIAEKKRLTVKTVIPDPVNVHVDFNMVRTVFINLLHNACKFSHNDGEIIISVKTINHSVIVSIMDSGTGIPEEKMSTLFGNDPTGSSPGTDNEHGSGLGLIICRDFTAMNGGQIWAETRIGQGSTFSVSFPLASSFNQS